MKRRFVIDVFLRVFLPLFLGGVIYILFRSEKLIMFKWLEIIRLNELISLLRQNINYNMPDWILYNLPDALWLFSLTSLLIIIWKRRISKTNLLYIILPLIISISWEIGQYLGIIQGTFDQKDLFFYIAAAIFSLQNIEQNFIKLTIKN